MDNFGDLIVKECQTAVINLLKKGEWIGINYSNRLNIEASFLRDVMSKVDMTKVMERVKSSVEDKIADSIMNAMATEVANDTKSIMSNKELREDIRAVIREKIRAVKSATT